MKNIAKITSTFLVFASVLCVSGCNQNNTATETQKSINVSNESLAYEETTAPETTVEEDTTIAETTTEEAASISTIGNYAFDLGEEFDTTMDNNMSDSVKVSLKLTTLNDSKLETLQDAFTNGYNENNSNTAYIPFDGYIKYEDFCNIKGCELEPWRNCKGYDKDGRPKYSKEGLSIIDISIDKEQDIYTESGKEIGNRKFEFIAINHDSVTKDKIETDNEITSSAAAVSIECVSGGEVIKDESTSIPDDAIIKGLLVTNSWYAKLTVSITLEDGRTIEINPEDICDASTAKKYFRELGLITTDDADEIYRYEMRANDQSRLLVFKNNNIVIVIGFTWNGGNYQYISVIKR